MAKIRDNIIELEKLIREQPCSRSSLASHFGYDQGSIDYWVGVLRRDGKDVLRYESKGRVYYRIRPDDFSKLLDMSG